MEEIVNAWLQWATPGVMLALAGLGWKMVHHLRRDLAGRMDRLDNRMDRMESGLHDVDKRLAVVETTVGHMDRRLERLEPRVAPPVPASER